MLVVNAEPVVPQSMKPNAAVETHTVQFANRGMMEGWGIDSDPALQYPNTPILHVLSTQSCLCRFRKTLSFSGGDFHRDFSHGFDLLEGLPGCWF